MKQTILFYIPPWIEQDRPELNRHWVAFTLRMSNILKDYHVEVLLGEYQYREITKKKLENTHARFHSIDNKEISNITDDYKMVHRLYEDAVDPTVQAKLIGLIRSKLRSIHKPDYVFFYMNPVGLLKNLYSDATFIACESGGLSSPFPKFWYLDLSGDLPCSYLLENANHIRTGRATSDQRAFCQSVRKTYHKVLPKGRDIMNIKRKARAFEFNVLLPLQVSNIYSLDLTCRFKSQFHYLKFVLDNIDERIGVVVSEHPYFPQFSKSWVKYFETLYPNFIYSNNTQLFHSSSQILIEHVDAVLNVSSTVAFLSFLWEKPLISLGENYFTTLSDKQGLEGLFEYLQSPDTIDKDFVLYSLLNRYWVSDTALFESDYLARLLEKSTDRTSCQFGFYDELCDPDTNLELILKTLHENAEARPKTFDSEKLKRFPRIPIIVGHFTDNRTSIRTVAQKIKQICTKATKQ